jgi:hypothetical protein
LLLWDHNSEINHFIVMGQLQKFEKAIEGKTVVQLFSVPEVVERFVANYKAATNRDDGENRLVQERFAYMQILAEKPDLAKVPNYFHVSALIFAATTGLSFRDNKLYVQPNGKGGLKVSSSPAGKREMFEMMPTVKYAPEAIIVMKGDNFVHDKLNGIVKVHETTKASEKKLVLENIEAAYQRIIFKDGSIKDVVVYHDDLVTAKKKSKMPNGPWLELVGEMVKKTATNRAFRLYHKYPDNIVLFHPVEDAEDTDYKEVEDEMMPPVSGQVDEETGEITQEPQMDITPTEEYKHEPKKETKPKSGQTSLMD